MGSIEEHLQNANFRETEGLDPASLEDCAGRFLDGLAASYAESRAVGTMTCTAYDTAWVAMVSRQREDGSTEWLFEDSFTWLLSQQLDDGGWSAYAAPIDGILSTLASLLAICKRIRQYRLATERLDEVHSLEIKRDAAVGALQRMLDAWDVARTTHVGYEIIAPAHLDMLEAEGLSFSFQHRDSLMAARDAKLARFKPEMLYGSKPLSVLHSLEAMIERVDFNRVQHHLVDGSMMSSPASTAAYLMNRSTWDDAAEAYIRRALKFGLGQGAGCVPSAYPSTLFEISWVFTLLAGAGYSKALFDKGGACELKHALTEAFSQNEGIIGFAPGLEPDADDTAVGMTALNLLTIPADADGLIKRFERPTHFQTYEAERNASFTTNCNVLSALVNAPDGSRLYSAQIRKVTTFLVKYWRESNGILEDKWSLTPLYSVMQMCKALAGFLKLQLESENPHLIESVSEVQHVLLQAISYLMRIQNDDGSWGTRGVQEETCYAILALQATIRFPFLQTIHPDLCDSLTKGNHFLRQRWQQAQQPEYLWVEKVSYASPTLSRAYTLAALRQSSLSTLSKETHAAVDQAQSQSAAKLSKLCSHMPIFKSLPSVQIKIAILEGDIMSTRMKAGIPNIFPRENARKETYLSFIPFTWAAGNQLETNALREQELIDMMIISAVIYQADEYMEKVVATLTEHEVSQLLAAIDSMHESEVNFLHGTLNGDHVDGQNDDTGLESDERPVKKPKLMQSSPNVEQILDTLQKFMTNVLQQPLVRRAIPVLRRQLLFDLKAFLKGHIHQVQANGYLRQKHYQDVDEKFASFFNWIRTTSSDHTGGPFALSYFCCLIMGREDAKPEQNLSGTMYIAQDVSRHVSSMCRMYNDWASVKRDEEEHNVNSVNFEEFRIVQQSAEKTSSDTNTSNGAVVHHETSSSSSQNLRDIEDARARLFSLAQYERRCLEVALDQLKQVASPDLHAAIRVFCNVTDIYGQMYVVKDMTPKLTKAQQEKNAESR